MNGDEEMLIVRRLREEVYTARVVAIEKLVQIKITGVGQFLGILLLSSREYKALKHWLRYWENCTSPTNWHEFQPSQDSNLTLNHNFSP